MRALTTCSLICPYVLSHINLVGASAPLDDITLTSAAIRPYKVFRSRFASALALLFFSFSSVSILAFDEKDRNAAGGGIGWEPSIVHVPLRAQFLTMVVELEGGEPAGGRKDDDVGVVNGGLGVVSERPAIASYGGGLLVSTGYIMVYISGCNTHFVDWDRSNHRNGNGQVLDSIASTFSSAHDL